jgi:hypothetical protein
LLRQYFHVLPPRWSKWLEFITSVHLLVFMIVPELVEGSDVLGWPRDGTLALQVSLNCEDLAIAGAIAIVVSTPGLACTINGIVASSKKQKIP